MITHIDVERFRALEHDGWVRAVAHPGLPLTIWNYTRATQYDRHWTPETLQARGLVTETDTGLIVARPFPKFFNLSEMPDDWRPAEGPVTVHQKWDGSLLIVAWYEPAQSFVFATRGSFTSEQAFKGRELWSRENRPNAAYERQLLIAGFTILYEVIYPENRIVVDYEDRESVELLAMIETATGAEPQVVGATGDAFRWYPNTYDFDLELSSGRLDVPPGSEGWVIRFANGERVKIKGDEYVRLHRILTGVTERRVWEALQIPGALDRFLENVPDEFDRWIRAVSDRLTAEYRAIEKHASVEYHAAMEYARQYADDVRQQQRHFATRAKETDYPELLFAMKSGKDYRPMIWKRIRPASTKPFRVDEE